MKKIILTTFLNGICMLLNAQITFNSLILEEDHRGFVATAIADMNNDYLDDIVRVNFYGQISIAFQQRNGSFDIINVDSVDYLGIAYGSWSICVADVNKDNFNDFFIGNMHYQYIYISNNSPTNYTRKQLDSVYFAQGANFVDIDKDGDLDLFVCNDDSLNYVYANDGIGNFSIDTTLISTVKWSGNYSSVWSDYDNDNDLDLYISKCKGGVNDSADPRRVNLLYRNDSTTYTEVAAIANIDDGSQSWSADFGDIDNDGDLDLIIANHYAYNRLYRNNGDGTFTRITAQSGIDEYTNAYVFQSLFADLDNDGWIDLILANEDNEKLIYQNNQDGTFSLVNSPLETNKLYSLSLGDLNNDGFIDMYSIRNSNPPNIYPDAILYNNGNTNNYIGITLENNNSKQIIGAKLKFYGSWGVQTREIRAGESYGIHNSYAKIFGLGNENNFDSIVVQNLENSQHCMITSLPHINSKYLIDLSNCLVTEIIDTTDNIEAKTPNLNVYAYENSIYIKSKHNINLKNISLYDITGQKINFKTQLISNGYAITPELKNKFCIVDVNGEKFKILMN